jgi:hypothetical protein
MQISQFKMHSPCSGTMGSYGCFSKFEVINSINVYCIVVSFSSLQWKNTEISREIQQYLMSILIVPHVRRYSDENQTVCPTLKK